MVQTGQQFIPGNNTDQKSLMLSLHNETVPSVFPQNLSDIPREVKLTAFTHALGCACKIRPQLLEKVLKNLPAPHSPSVLVGFETSDDAAVFAISDKQAIVQTVDFIPPVVDDPYMFGAIAAANAISDIYAMGATPLFALSIVGFPDRELPLNVLEMILKGAHDKAAEAGIEIIGGHSIEDAEPKFGLSVTGLIDRDKILRNKGAFPGDLLLLTKPIGSGIIMTALKQGIAKQADVQQAMETMAKLNKTGAEILVNFPVNACTDVTGFGLLGHMKEMVSGSPVSAIINSGAVPLLPGVLSYAVAGAVPGGTKNNQEFVENIVRWDDTVSTLHKLVLCDAQTSGGLLISLPEKYSGSLLEALKENGAPEAVIVGKIVPGQGTIEVLNLPV
jgi:selenium donor protein